MRVVVGNLPDDVSEEGIRAALSPFAPVEKIKLVKESGTPSALIEMEMTRADAEAAEASSAYNFSAKFSVLLKRTTCGSIIPTAWPWTTPKWAVSGLAAEWAAPSMLFSMAVPAQAAPSSIQPRASRSGGREDAGQAADEPGGKPRAEKSRGDRGCASLSTAVSGMSEGVEARCTVTRAAGKRSAADRAARLRGGLGSPQAIF